MHDSIHVLVSHVDDVWLDLEVADQKERYWLGCLGDGLANLEASLRYLLEGLRSDGGKVNDDHIEFGLAALRDLWDQLISFPKQVRRKRLGGVCEPKRVFVEEETMNYLRNKNRR